MAVVPVIVADRSMAVRAVLRRLFEGESQVEVVGEAANGPEVVRLASEGSARAIILDFDLPSLNGRALVEQLAARSSAPIFVLTPKRNRENTRLAMALHRLGVVEVMPKPEVPDEWTEIGRALAEALQQVGIAADGSTQAIEEPDETPVSSPDLRFVAIGASTGGPAAVYETLTGLGRSPAVGVAIVQHIADGFEGAYAEWLAGDLGLDVAVARHGEILRGGMVRIAPPGSHLRLDPDGRLDLDEQSPPVGGHRPAVDILFRSLLDHPVGRVAAVLLSGMGSDGADAMADLRRADVLTIAQNEASCAVFGMPRAAIEGRAAAAALEPARIGRLLSRAGGDER
jgi:chemotaxis response regulator CheB